MICACRAECEDRLRAEFRIEMNAAVAESEQRWQDREQELQTQTSELQSQLSELQAQVGHKPHHEHSSMISDPTLFFFGLISFHFITLIPLEQLEKTNMKPVTLR